MRTSGHKLADLEADISELGDDWVPPVTKDRLAWFEYFRDIKKTGSEALKQIGECNDFPMYIESMRSFRKEFNERIRVVKRYVKDVKTKQEIMHKRRGRQYYSSVPRFTLAIQVV